MKIEASEIKRPKTNLVTNPNYHLNKAQMGSGFMGVFTWNYNGDPRKTLLKLAIGPVASAVNITLGKRPAPKNAEQRKARKAENSALRTWEANRSKIHLDQFTKLKKVANATDPHFLLSVPIFNARDASDFAHMFYLFSGVMLEPDTLSHIDELFSSKADQTFKPDLAMKRSGLPGPTLDIFKTTLLGVTYEFSGEGLMVFLNFKINKEEAQALVSADWMEIRPVDLYPLFSMWVEAEFVSKFYSKSITSLSRIAATLPKHDPEDERTDQYGIGIDLDGEPIWLPKECNNTQRYESMYAAASAHPGDTFALRTAAVQNAPTLPENIPILVDWVNNKFTYSNSAGKPVIMALEHLRKCTSSMALNILRRPVPDKYLERLGHYADVAGVSDNPARYGIDTTYATIAEYVNVQILGKREGFVLRYLDLTTDQHDAEFEGVKTYVHAVYEGIKNHLDAFYNKYAVSTTMQVLGTLGLITHYGTDMARTRTEANTIRKAALQQGVNPDWTPPDMPLVTDKFNTPEGGMLPHQAKIRNLLKDSPDNAVLSVDAGGGKSMLSITDILYEIKANRSHPYLIMCPSHLVANYVAELVEFTDGRVNVIPITSYNIRTTGIARYEEILRTAPINTVLVIDYFAPKFRAKAMGYGTSSVLVYPVIEMIRQFKPGYVMMDESHFLKNANSKFARSVLTLVADIPKKRIASGTLNPDSPSDLAGQMAILDPSVFGSRANFNETYGEDIRGDRVMKWRTKGPNSISEVLPMLKQNVVWAQAKRKEWACALPRREDHFIGVDLTPAQRQIYNALFDDMIQQIRKEAETNKKAKKLLDNLTGGKATKTDEDDFGDLSNDSGDEDEDILGDVEDVGPALQPYLADIERFVTNPAGHPYAKNGFVMANGERVPPLSGDDLLSPKALALKQMLTKHLSESPNKVIVFVNYNQSAESLFEAMPEELRSQGMLYSTSQKTELVNKFKTDKSIRWMIGIRKSLEVGLNLQVADCLIRMEGVWNPGEQEQGDSRIARPYFGPGGDKRSVLQFYTIVADRTIDITKAARLRAKIVAVAKFENTGNPNYEAIEDIPIIPMNLETITTQNDFETNLAQYHFSMAMLNNVMKNENEEYKQKILAEGGFKFTQVKRAANPGGAAILSRVPYAEGTELYKASELGLVRIDNFLGMELAAEEDDDEGGGGDEEEAVETDLIKEQRNLLMGRRVHCEFGDGVIVGASAVQRRGYINRVLVRLDDGTTVPRITITNAFIVTRTETNSIDMRNKLAQAAGLEVTAEITVPGVYVKQTKFSQKELREQERQREIERQKQLKKADKVNKTIAVSLELQVVNGYLRFGYTGDDARVTKALESLGFRMDQPHYYARIRTYRQLLKQVTKWADAGFNTTNQVDNESLQLLTNELSKNGLQSHRHYSRLTNSGGFRNYLRMIWKPTVDKKLLNMFALVTDGGHSDPVSLRLAEKAGSDEPAYAIAYLCLPAGSGHPGSKLAVSSKYRVPGMTWYISEPSLSIFVSSLNSAKAVFTRLKEAGIVINNTDELNQAAKSVRKIAFKVDEHVDVQDEEPEEPVKTKKRRA